MNNRRCVICGKEFSPNSGNQKICGDPSCLKARRKMYVENHKEMYRELNKKYRQQPRVKKHMAMYDK